MQQQRQRRQQQQRRGSLLLAVAAVAAAAAIGGARAFVLPQSAPSGGVSRAGAIRARRGAMEMQRQVSKCRLGRLIHASICMVSFDRGRQAKTFLPSFTTIPPPPPPPYPTKPTGTGGGGVRPEQLRVHPQEPPGGVVRQHHELRRLQLGAQPRRGALACGVWFVVLGADPQVAGLSIGKTKTHTHPQ